MSESRRADESTAVTILGIGDRIWHQHELDLFHGEDATRGQHRAEVARPRGGREHRGSHPSGHLGSAGERRPAHRMGIHGQAHDGRRRKARRRATLRRRVRWEARQGCRALRRVRALRAHRLGHDRGQLRLRQDVRRHGLFVHAGGARRAAHRDPQRELLSAAEPDGSRDECRDDAQKVQGSSAPPHSPAISSTIPTITERTGPSGSPVT